MFDRFDNWLMDRLVRLYVAASARRRRRLGLAADGDFEGVRFIDTDAGQARFVYSYRLANKMGDYGKGDIPVNGTIAEVIPVDEEPDPGLERVVVWAISDDDISVSLPVKYTRKRLTDFQIKDLLGQMAEIARHRIQCLT